MFHGTMEDSTTSHSRPPITNAVWGLTVPGYKRKFSGKQMVNWMGQGGGQYERSVARAGGERGQEGPAYAGEGQEPTHSVCVERLPMEDGG